MKILLAALVLSTLGAAPPASAISGTWSIEPSGRPDSVQLELRRGSGGHRDSTSFTIERSGLVGLPSGPTGSSQGEVRFTLRRDAGTFTFEGSTRRGEGAGHFSFSPDPAYEADLRAMGYALSEDDLFGAAAHDLSRVFIRELSGLGYSRLPLDDLFAFRIHGVTPQIIRELGSLGYTHLPADDLVAMRIHGATPEFIGGLKSLGYDRVSGDDLVAMRIHGVSADFIRELRNLGYSRVPADQLVAMRIHGVTADYVRRVNAGRSDPFSIDDLVSMKIHGVAAD